MTNPLLKTSDPMRRLVLDIETTPIQARLFGIRNQFLGLDQIDIPTRMLTVAAKWYDQPKTLYFSAFEDVDRSEMVDSIWEMMNHAHVLIHYNGIRFDQKHLNREFVEVGPGIEPSPYQVIDMFSVVKRKFALPSYKLDYVLTWLGLENKVTHDGFFRMLDKMYSDDPVVALKARKLFEKYNKGDVTKTQQVYEYLMSWVPNHPNMQLFVDRAEDSENAMCPVCGSYHTKKDGTAARGNLGRVQKHECLDCGKYFRGNKTIIQAVER